jgi:PKD repeat protein
MQSRVLGVVLAIAAGAVACASASAATICVPALVSGCDSSKSTVTAALAAANAAADADEILLAPGSYALPAGVVGQAGYPVQIVGSGIEQTVIQAGGADFYGVSLYGTSDAITDLTIHEAAAGNHTALLLDGGRAQRVRIDQRANSNSNAVAAEVRNGASFLDGEALSSLVTSSGIPAALVLAAAAGQTDHVTNSLVQGDDALSITGVGTVVVSRSRVVGSSHTVDAFDGTTTIVEDSTLRGGPAVATARNTFDAALTLRHDTLDTAQVQAWGSSAGHVAHVVVSNTALVGGGPEFTQFVIDTTGTGTGEIEVDHSFYGGAARVDQTPAPSSTNEFIDGGGDVIGTDARLLSDLEPPFDSPLVDAGGAVSADESPTDLAGEPRTVNGRTDIGAYEYGRHAPTVDASVGRASALVGEPLQFFATALDADPGEVPAVTWLFDDGATATGMTAVHAFATPGTHIARATATDPTGQTATSTVLVTVTSPPALNKPAAPAFLFKRLKSRSGVVRVLLSCPATATDCSGALTLQLKRERLGRARYALVHGTKRTVRVKLVRSARRRLAHARHGLRVQVVAKPADAAARRKTVRLTGR